GTNDGEQMAGGVHAHQPVAAWPVHVENKLLTHRRREPMGKRLVNNNVLRHAMTRFAKSDLRSVGPLEETGIARLAARGGIEEGLIERDTPILGHGRYGCFRGGEIEVVAIEGIYLHGTVTLGSHRERQCRN